MSVVCLCQSFVCVSRSSVSVVRLCQSFVCVSRSSVSVVRLYHSFVSVWPIDFRMGIRGFIINQCGCCCYLCGSQLRFEAVLSDSKFGSGFTIAVFCCVVGRKGSWSGRRRVGSGRAGVWSGRGRVGSWSDRIWSGLSPCPGRK